MFKGKIKGLDLTGIFYLIINIMVLIVLFWGYGCGFKGKLSQPNGDRAFEHLKKLVNFGPHPSGSEGIKRVQEYLKTHLQKEGLKVQEQNFTASTPIGNLPMKNIIGLLPGKTEQAIALATHYETKYFTEFNFIGANDGCSGTALLLELASVLSERHKDLYYSIWFIFLDGEEAFLQWSPQDSLYGSKYMVRDLLAKDSLSKLQAFILLDMIGDKDLTICRETFSTAWLQDLIWAVASRMNYYSYFQECHQQVMDDHLPFLQVNIPSIDIIDFNYGGQEAPGVYWHTAHDTLDKLSPESLKIVGEVVYQGLFEIQKELRRVKGDI